MSQGIRSFKRYYDRFHKWQQDTPHFVNRHQGTMQHCHNCGTEYDGNFCPICGQRAGVGRVGWKSIKENVSLLWGLDSRSLPNTLLQLLLRPGYLVRDYISGRRQVSFPPIKMLVIVCLVAVIIESVFNVNNEVMPLHYNIPVADKIVQWFNANKSWATLFIQIFFIFPTWIVFRFAPRYPRHSLPEGFFLQVFLSVQALLLGLLNYLFGNIDSVLMPIYMIITYKQLFGYGWWGTLWRCGVTIVVAFMMMFPLVAIGFLFGDDERTRNMIEVGPILLAFTVILIVVMLYVSYRIGKRTHRKSLTGCANKRTDGTEELQLERNNEIDTPNP